ncbi:MAG: GAF domain-containing protein [Myxococcaceae bacterium]|nr:GAF domain-containing protein [Myxococcaceae bacterium]
MKLLGALPVGVVWIRDGVIVWANQTVSRMLGIPVDQLVGSDPFQHVAPEDVPLARERSAVRLSGGPAPSAYEVSLLCADKSRLRVELFPQLLSPQSPEEGTVVVIREIDLRVRHSELLFALGEISTRAQRARTVAGVIDEAVRGLFALGFHTLFFQLDDGEHARLVSHALLPELVQNAERLVGGPLLGVRLPLSKIPRASEAIASGRATFVDDLEQALTNLLDQLGHTLPEAAAQVLRGAGLARIVIAPVAVRGQPWGFFITGGLTLDLHDAGALSLFAAHVGSALEVAESIEDLERKNASLEAVHEVAMFASEAPLSELAPKLLGHLSRALRADASCLYVVDPERGELVIAGIHGEAGDLPTRYGRIPLQRTATGEVASSLRPRALSLEEWPEVSRPDMAQAGFVENAIVPLVVNGRLAGTVNLSRKRRERFSDEELRSAEILAAQVSLHLERIRLDQDVRRRVHDLSLINELGAMIAQHLELEHVLQAAVRQVSKIVEVPNTFLLVLEEKSQQLAMLASNVEGQDVLQMKLSMDEPGVAAEAVRTRRPVVLHAAAELEERASQFMTHRFGHTALMAAPLLSEGRSIGALVLGETRGPRVFSASEVERAVIVANQLATAIENARLYEEQRRRVGQLRLLLQMSQVITGSLDLTQILEASAQSITRMIDATDAFIWLLHDTELRGVVASDPAYQAHFSKVRIPLSTASAVSHAIVGRQPIRVADAMASPYVNRELNARYKQRSLVAIPLMLRDVPIGAVAIGDRRRRREFTDDEVERATLISRQVAVAIENARLFEDLKRSYQELSRAQQELVKRERLAALGELSAVVAHEVRNPLGVIFNSLASLKRLIPDSGDGRMLLEIVGEEADRLNRMVSDLLDFARPNEPQLEREPLEPVLIGALEAAARAMPAPHVQVRFEPEPGIEAPVDAQMLRQAVVNLVLNAVQAMPRGGTVVVRTGVETRNGARFARIEVEDDGPGIPPELVDRVFQPFFTTRAAGTGLGLAVVKRIADAHRAELTVRSTPGRGSTFTILLPM